MWKFALIFLIPFNLFADEHIIKEAKLKNITARWLGNFIGLYANRCHNAELTENDFLATFFNYNGMNKIRVGL